ncbi:MAG: ribosome maturation factor RimP [Propionibacteriaceae bacterium]|nr:ribosome maturation factor RimP [Propionibacteriaceae bacterium]
MKIADLEGLLTPVVAAQNLEIDRIELMSAGRRKVVRVFLDGDGPAGLGPSLDEIAEATRAISMALDDSPITGQAPYTLEVSSRGVGRPLTEPKHYRRNRGRLVALTGPELDLTGRIVAVGDEEVTLDLDGSARSVGFAGIDKAVVQVELNRLPDEDEEEI